jgi:ring-1,2-phenylacetyl-CoA epoxidase subunit PaaC
MPFDNAYEAIIEDNDHHHWAFGSSFHDPLAGIDLTVPEDVDADDLASYCLMLGDDALIMSHRLSEMCTNAPELEDEVALANIGLDLLGQARLLLARAGDAEGSGRDEDALAFLRNVTEFRNVRLVERPNGDFAESMARLLVFSTWRLALLDRLRASRDPLLGALAAKGLKEVTYHRDYAARWVVRLGDGTDTSHERLRQAFLVIWPLVAELFTTGDIERRMAEAGVGVDPSTLRAEFDDVLAQVLHAATIERPKTGEVAVAAGETGRDGAHTDALGVLLTDLQSVARANPGATW